MITTPIISDTCPHGASALACRAVSVWHPLVVILLALGSSGCRTPPLPELQRQAELAAEKRGHTSAESARVRQGEEVHTVPEVLAHVQGELDEAAVVRVALINNPGLAAEYANLGIARSVLLGASRYSNPTLEASERFGHDNNSVVDLKAVQDIVNVALLPRRREAATQSLDAAKDRLTSRILAVARDARAAFVDYQTAVVLQGQERTLVDCREAAMDVARRMADAGNLTTLELATSEQRYHAVQIELASLQVEVGRRREAVNQVMGLHEDTGWQAKLTDGRAVETIQIPAAGAERHALDASLELAAQRHDIVALTKKRGIEQAKAYLPEIKVGVDSERDSGGAWAVGPALVLTVPLFDQGQAAIAMVDAHMQAYWNRYAQTAVVIASATRAALTRLDASQQALRTQQEKVVPLRKRMLRETLRQYNGMLVGVFDLLRAKEQEIEAQARLAELTSELRLACLDLQLLLAGGEPMEKSANSIGASVQAEVDKDAH